MRHHDPDPPLSFGRFVARRMLTNLSGACLLIGGLMVWGAYFPTPTP